MWRWAGGTDLPSGVGAWSRRRHIHTPRDSKRDICSGMLQEGESLGFPHSRLMPVIGLRYHGLRINDEAGTFRIVHRADTDAVVILDVFKKTTEQTPPSIIETCRQRLREYDQLIAQ